MSEQEKNINRLNFENLIWIVFIVISAMDIFGDEFLRKNIVNGDLDARKKANDIFLIVTLISILIYIYFFWRNYYDYKKYQTKSYEIRLLGSILFLTGTICLLYFQVSTTSKFDSPSNI